MSTLLVVTRGLPSLVYPCLELARRLAAAGHQVTVAGDPETEPLARRLALPFLTLERERAEGARASRVLGVDTFAEALRRDRPDLVLINGEMHAHVIAALAAGARVALLNSFVSIWRSPGVPPPHHRGQPGVGWRGSRPGAWLLWRNLRMRTRRRRWLEQVRTRGRDRLSRLRSYARLQGVDLSRLTDDTQWLIPFTWRLPVLSLHAREFEFPHQPPGNVRYVGPMILEDRPDRLTPADRARLDILLARRRDGGAARTLVCAAFGSAFSAAPSLLRRMVGIAADRPGWDLVVSLSGKADAAALGPPTERVHVFSWLPQLEVLARADVAITHGGINSVDECVAHGVPMLVYCGGETDMAGTTSRVQYHGLGIAGARRDGTKEIRAHVDRLLADMRYRSRVRQFQQLYAAYAADRVAERAVEALLSRAGAR
jgi:zeaxanthin glucosyltransferase